MELLASSSSFKSPVRHNPVPSMLHSRHLKWRHVLKPLLIYQRLSTYGGVLSYGIADPRTTHGVLSIRGSNTYYVLSHHCVCSHISFSSNMSDGISDAFAVFACMKAHHGGDRMFAAVGEHAVLDIHSRGEVIKLDPATQSTLHY